MLSKVAWEVEALPRHLRIPVFTVKYRETHSNQVVTSPRSTRKSLAGHTWIGRMQWLGKIPDLALESRIEIMTTNTSELTLAVGVCLFSVKGPWV